MYKYLKSHALAGIFAAHIGLLFDAPMLHKEMEPEARQTEVLQDTTTRSKRTATYHHSDNNSSTEVTYDGTITFTEDEKDIKSISPGGFFKFSQTTFGNRRAVHIESNSSGELKRTYYVGKTQEAYEPEGRNWLADVLPEIIATTGIGAEDRVKRIYTRSGVSGVLSAIDAIDSDYVKAIYFGYLLGQNGLKDDDLTKVISEVDDEISSDYEKGKLLQKVSGTYLQNPTVVGAYMEAVMDISSDYEKAKVLRHVLNNNKLSEANFSKTLAAVDDISSDYEKSKVLSELLNKQNLPNNQYNEIMEVVADISSDYEKSKVLTQLISDKNKGVTEHFTTVLQTISSISSDYEKGKTFTTLFNNTKLTDTQYVEALQAVIDISSDYEKGKILQLISKTIPRNKPAVMDAYKKAAKSISSDHEYRKVMTSIE